MQDVISCAHCINLLSTNTRLLWKPSRVDPLSDAKNNPTNVIRCVQLEWLSRVEQTLLSQSASETAK